jgi:hypothetical protein
MPLRSNPYISSSVIDAAPGTGTNTQPQSGYNESPEKNALAINNSARNAGPNSALNGQLPPPSRLRTTNGLNTAIQNQVDIANNAFLDDITEESSTQNSIAAQRIFETIVSGGASVGAITNILDTSSSNLIQAARSANLPIIDITALLTAEANNFDWGDPETVVRPVPVDNGDWRVRIAAPLGLGDIIFPVLPALTLSHKANYKEDGLVHTNYQFLSYKNSQPDDITIACEWPVETEQDAKDWLSMILLGRSLTKMFYGASDYLGNPPPICTLRGYSGSNVGVILPDMPVVVKSFSFDLKDDVSYIEVKESFVPRLSTVTFTCAIVYNRNSQRAFNFDAYRRGVVNTPIRY